MKHLLLIVISLLLLNSCSKFQHHMKSTDMEAKYEAAVKYYEKKDYYHALQLFEELISVYRGTSKAEKSYYYYVYCTYYVDDFTMAAYHFNNFVQSYPSSTYAEEMQYMYAYCYYLDSPVSSLDQTSTYDAIDKFQLFINKFPNSKKVEESNKYIDELRLKLEVKSFDNAKLYYRTENYKAAVVALLIGACVPGYAADFTYSDWQQASEQWKRGYAYAALSFQTQVARSESAKVMRERKVLR